MGIKGAQPRLAHLKTSLCSRAPGLLQRWTAQWHTCRATVWALLGKGDVLQVSCFLSSLCKHHASLAYHLILRQPSTVSRISPSLENLTNVTESKRKTVDSSRSLAKTGSPRVTAALKEPVSDLPSPCVFAGSLSIPLPHHIVMKIICTPQHSWQCLKSESKQKFSLL